jgi:hypothetical protein
MLVATHVRIAKTQIRVSQIDLLVICMVHGGSKENNDPTANRATITIGSGGRLQLKRQTYSHLLLPEKLFTETARTKSPEPPYYGRTTYGCAGIIGVEQSE